MNLRSASLTTLFHLGLVLGLVHLAISLELGLTLAAQGAMLRTVLLFIYPLALAGLGIGAALDTRLAPDRDPSNWLRAGGGALLLFLLAIHLTGFLGIQATGFGKPETSLLAIFFNASLMIPACIYLFSLGLFYVLVGVSIAPLIRRLKAGGSRSVGHGWGIHLLGLVVGYLLVDPLVMAVGPSCILLAIGLSMVLLPRGALLPLVLLLGSFHALELEGHLEGMRRMPDLDAAFHRLNMVRRSEQGLSAIHFANKSYNQTVREPLAIGWSRHAQVRVIEGRSIHEHKLGIYNFRFQWSLYSEKQFEGGDTTPPTSAIRKKLYGLFPKDEPVVLLGTGGGQGLSAISFPLHSGVTAVEMDPRVVQILRDEHPDWNDHVYQEASVVAGEGRSFLEGHPGNLGVIVVESARFRSPSSLLPATAPMYLYTREALRTYIDRLAPGGLLMVQFNKVVVGESLFLPRHVLTALEDMGASYVAYHDGNYDMLCIFATPPGTDVHERIAALDLSEMIIWDGEDVGIKLPSDRKRGHTSSLVARGRYDLTDNTPFWSWANMSEEQRYNLNALVIFGLLISVLPAVLISRREGRKSGWNPTPFAFVLGVAHSTVHISTFYLVRSYFTDPVLSVLMVVVLLMIWGAVGSALSSRVPKWLLKKRARVGATTLLIGIHFLLVMALPFEQVDVGVRWLAAVLATAPGGVAMGCFFPLAISRATPERVGVILLADALGTLAGYGVVYLVCLPFGISIQVWFALAAYILAALLLKDEMPVEGVAG